MPSGLSVDGEAADGAAVSGIDEPFLHNLHGLACALDGEAGAETVWSAGRDCGMMASPPRLDATRLGSSKLTLLLRVAASTVADG